MDLFVIESRMHMFWWSAVLLVGGAAVAQDRRRLAFDMVTAMGLFLLFLTGLALNLPERPWWTLTIAALFLWGLGLGGRSWGWPGVIVPPLTPVVLNAAATRYGFIGQGDLLLFVTVCLPLPWWGPWVVSAVWHLYLWLGGRRSREILLPATPGLLAGGVIAAALAWLIP